MPPKHLNYSTNYRKAIRLIIYQLNILYMLDERGQKDYIEIAAMRSLLQQLDERKRKEFSTDFYKRR